VSSLYTQCTSLVITVCVNIHQSMFFVLLYVSTPHVRTLLNVFYYVMPCSLVYKYQYMEDLAAFVPLSGVNVGVCLPRDMTSCP